ncbi:hypothetical protein V1289_009492 [Bradyrhizobium sp. AZCC 2289]
MTCESPIDQGDSRSYNITVLLGSHRVKGTRRSRAPVEGTLGFFMFGPRRNLIKFPGGTARWRGWAPSARDCDAVPHVMQGGKPSPAPLNGRKNNAAQVCLRSVVHASMPGACATSSAATTPAVATTSAACCHSPKYQDEGCSDPNANCQHGTRCFPASPGCSFADSAPIGVPVILRCAQAQSMSFRER